MFGGAGLAGWRPPAGAGLFASDLKWRGGVRLRGIEAVKSIADTRLHPIPDSAVDPLHWLGADRRLATCLALPRPADGGLRNRVRLLGGRRG